MDSVRKVGWIVIERACRLAGILTQGTRRIIALIPFLGLAILVGDTVEQNLHASVKVFANRVSC